MIEGARHLPWKTETLGREPRSLGGLVDCKKCRRERPREERQEMRCGFEPAIDPDDALSVWRHEAFDKSAAPSTCPAYAESIPIVIEAQRMLPHYRRGVVAERVRGRAPGLAYEVLAALDTSTEATRRFRDAVVQLEHEKRMLAALGGRARK